MTITPQPRTTRSRRTDTRRADVRRTPARRSTTRALAAVATALVGAGVLTACGSSDGATGAGAGGADGDGPSVVASTSVYADIAQQVAGENASVESVISDPTADPHSYEASPADAARVATADLVVYNGGGYDSFVDLALENTGEVPVVRAVDEFARVTGEAVPEDTHDHGADAGQDEGHGEHDDHSDNDADHDDHAHESGTNEHVWFSLPTTAAVAEQVATRLAELDPENADEYRANARSFGDALTPLEAQIDQIHDRGHFAYAQTERIGAHLFDAAHLADKTPRGFLSSVEDDADPSAADLTAMLDLLDTRQVSFLAYNSQTETGVTSRVREAAEEAGVVVVDLTETLPDGTDYLTWITDIVGDLAAALDGATPVDDDDH